MVTLKLRLIPYMGLYGLCSLALYGGNLHQAGVGTNLQVIHWRLERVQIVEVENFRCRSRCRCRISRGRHPDSYPSHGM